MSFNEVKKLRKAGKLEKALELAKSDLTKNPDDIWNKKSIAWVYYEFLKKNCQYEKLNIFIENLKHIKELELPEDEKMIFDNCSYKIVKIIFAFQKVNQADFSKLNEIYSLIKNFHFTKPSESYTILYKAFHKGYKKWSKYLDFADWWGFDNFRSQDFLEEEFEGNKIMAIVEQAYIAYSKKLLEGETIESNGVILNNSINKKRITDFMPKLETIINKHPKYQYPPYFKAKLLLALGNRDNVLSAFLPFAKQKRNNFWVWELMAEIFSKDKELVFACYSKALSLKTHENYIVKLRQKYAELLIDKELYLEAKTEIEKLTNTRLQNKWKLPKQVKQWIKEEWYKRTKIKNDNKNLYLLYSIKAEEILFQDIPEEIIAVEFVNKNKNILSFVRDKEKHGFFNYSSFIENPKIGNILKVRFKDKVHNGYYTTLTIKKEESNIESSAIKEFDGILKIISPQGFGFVEDIFIESKVIKNKKLEDKQEVKGKAILSYNKKKSEWGWKAFQVE